MVSIDQKINYELINDLSNLLENNAKNILEQFIKSQIKQFDAIIDGGNIIHARQGTINQYSLIDLENIISNIKKTIGNPLLVIHRRHLKTFPDLINKLKLMNVSYYLTPYNMNDDFYILWFFLKMNTNAFIISNDKYRDHIFKFETSKKNIIYQYNLSQFNYILHQQTLDFDINTGYIKPKPTYSRCIQLKDGKIYVPHQNGNFIEITI